MAELVKVDIRRVSQTCLEVLISNIHPDAFDLSKVGTKETPLDRFAAYALGLLMIPASKNGIKSEFIKSVKKYREEEGLDPEKIEQGLLNDQYFLEDFNVVNSGALDYKEKLKQLKDVTKEETDEEYEGRMGKLENLEKPWITLALTFKPELRPVLQEFEKESFKTACDYYSV